MLAVEADLLGLMCATTMRLTRVAWIGPCLPIPFSSRDVLKRSVIVDLNHVEGESLPASQTIFYQCSNCWSILPSQSDDNLHCSCENISIDIDAGRAGARDEQLMRVLQIVSDSENS